MKNASAAIVLFLFILATAAMPVLAATTAAELSVFRPSTAVFYTRSMGEDETFTAIRWGLSTDVLVPADYDGDGITDAAIWRPENGVWYIQKSTDGTAMFIKWGQTTLHSTGGLPDVPVPADFDGDGTADIAIWRPDTGEWFILNSESRFSQTKAVIFHWGKLGDVPVQQDYDGDGMADFAVFRPAGNLWYIYESLSQSWKIYTFGLAGSDTLVPSDYTGDGKADLAVYRSGTWYVLNSETGETEPFQFGFSDSTPVPGDYDGDGQTDFAVFRNGEWLIYESSAPRLRAIHFGSENDIPLNSLRAKPSMVAVP